MDGITQGVLKSSPRPFKNISEKCVPIKPSTALSKGQPQGKVRPLIGLVRESKPVLILLDAIRGNDLSCTGSMRKSFAAAIRMVSGYALPAHVFSSFSVCGRSRGEVAEDVGDQGTVHRLRKFVVSCFDGNVLIYRMISPLYSLESNSSIGAHLRDLIFALRPGTQKWKAFAGI